MQLDTSGEAVEQSFAKLLQVMAALLPGEKIKP
jgi:hypothetical protein